MVFRVESASPWGVEARMVEVEVQLSNGLPGMSTVGLPDTAVKEARERVRSALAACGYSYAPRKITANLAPADLRKEGAAFDLPLAIAILGAAGQIPEAAVDGRIILGELALDGTVRPVRGVLPIAVTARAEGRREMYLPLANAREAAVVAGLQARGVSNLPQMVEALRGAEEIPPTRVDWEELSRSDSRDEDGLDLRDIKGQESARRALEVSAAGGHNLLMVGPPGTGKTMLARRYPGLLPSFTLDEALETSKVHSVAGLLRTEPGLVTRRPFRAPHHTISDAGMIGGGSYPMPGEVSLAHGGVLFLDELPEFRRNVLEVLRQPLEDGEVTISRALTSLTFPARFTMVAAMNPCPCGNLGRQDKPCLCSPLTVQRYRSRISGPLLDRIDQHVEVGGLSLRELGSLPQGEHSRTVRERVAQARTVQLQRFQGTRLRCNAQMSGRHLRRWCELDPSGRRLLHQAVRRLGFTARAYDRILKLARTIADLDGEESIRPPHVAEALRYRVLDRREECQPE